jgi:hypothetical protein
MMSITAAYKPSFQLKPSFLLEKALAPIRRFPASVGFIFVCIAAFFSTFRAPAVVDFASENFLFSETAPLWQWPLRTLSSQLIFYDSTGLAILIMTLAVIIFYIEKEVFDKKWAIYLLSFFMINEMVIRTFCGFLYKNYPNLATVPELVNLFPDNGVEILLTSLAGFATIFIGFKKDLFFAFGILMFFALSLISPLYGVPATAPLYGSTFFIEGYIIGYFYLNFQRQKDILASKNKPEEDDSAEVSPIKNVIKQKSSAKSPPMAKGDSFDYEKAN